MRAPSHDPRYDFEVRADSPSDLFVIREIFCENIYRVSTDSFVDTGVVLDIGANIGVFSVFAASLIDFKASRQNGAKAKVYAYEPEPHNLELLKANVKTNGLEQEIKIIPKAIGASAGKSYITNEHGNSKLDDTFEDATECDVISLADIFTEQRIEYVDVLKLDVEGYEYNILLNTSRETLNKIRYITFEFDADERFGELTTKLSETHALQVLGSHERGGYVFAKRY